MMPEEHERLREEVAAYAAGALDDGEREQVAEHLRGCADCARLLMEYQAAVALLPFALPAEPPPPETRAALMARVRREGRRNGATAPLTPAMAPDRPSPAHIGPAIGRWLRPLGWAAAAVVVLGLVMWNVQLQRDRDDTAADLAQLAGTPEERVAAMVNTSAAPGASGRLYLVEDGRSGVLAVSGLPRLQPGRAYQFWFATADKSRRDSAGVFQVDAGGQALVSVTVPGGLEQYAEIWVTQEPAGGSAVPTAPHYLEGPL